MKVFFSKEFLSAFLSKPSYISVADQFLDSLLNSYSEIEIIQEGTNTTEEFSKSELRLRYGISGDSRKFILSENIEKDLACTPENQLSLFFTAETIDKSLLKMANIIVFTISDYEEKIIQFKRDLSFGFILNSQKDWDKLKIANSSLVKNHLEKLTVLDPYIFADYYKSGKVENLERPFLFIINKIAEEESLRNLEVFTITEEFDNNRRSNISYARDIRAIIDFLDEILPAESSFKVIDNGKVNRSSKFDFHDRNIFSNLFILKVGIGFTEKYNDYTNSEVECYSIFDKWGHDLIRHRKRMVSKYLQTMRPQIYSR
ncbi:Uncharacterised protein [Chryseobacterium taklimakanense]|uniref:Uncharacterized protein n=1 Tax=Chryseobacterium taklimakanense TaxID=536441 RepID=A0A239WEE8_9FLAO|nr:hypothetical protein [Chryseobacterium taklimakanense]SNV31994.1 Uncharacterised protein [Chryseobacterium taklimakanense]